MKPRKSGISEWPFALPALYNDHQKNVGSKIKTKGESPMKKLRIIVIALLCAALAGACAYRAQAPVAKPAYTPPMVSYSGGILDARYAASFDQVWNAALVSLEDLKMPVVSTQKVAGGLINATGTDGTPLQITIQPLSPGNTEVQIKVGAVGNEQASRIINDQIRSRLGM